MAQVTAIMMKAIDNVATVVQEIDPHREITLQIGGDEVVVHITERIRFGHKFAVRDIKKGDPILKYGESIGVATRDIQRGQHVHVHNLESTRGRGDLPQAACQVDPQANR
jgi:altronate dehydratase small subunit